MANGHGGKRLGSGRKKKNEVLRALDGNAGHRGRVLQHPSAANDAAAAGTTPAAPIVLDEEHAPDDLTTDERNVWLRLGALAVESGTLTPRYADDFKKLCRNFVKEQWYWTQASDCMGPNHRGLIKLLESEMDRFGLRPFGKPEAAAPAKPAVDPLKEKYFGRG